MRHAAQPLGKAVFIKNKADLEHEEYSNGLEIAQGSSLETKIG
jgi:hypothetical protein